MKEFFAKVFTKENMKEFFYSFVWLAILLIAIDLITKLSFLNYFGVDAFVNDSIRVGTGISREALDNSKMIQIIPGFLYISAALNLGAAWSMGYNDNYDGVNPVLLVISIVMSIGLIIYYITQRKKLNNWVKAALMLMIAGAIGNLIDRAFYRESITGFKGVIDWIQVYFYVDGVYKSFPTFNIADSSLVVGVAILFVIFVIDEVKESLKKAKDGEYKYSPKEREEMKKNEGNKDR